MYELIKQVIESNKLDVTKVLDRCSAICVADNFVGTNRLNLTFDAFLQCEADDKEWEKVLNLLGIQTHIVSSTIKVQHYRVICDALVISCNESGSDVGTLTSEASSIVARVCGLNLRSREYLDINGVKGVLQELVSESYDFSELHGIEEQLYELEAELKPFGFDMKGVLGTVLGDFSLPDNFLYIREGKMNYESTEQATNIFKERVIYCLEQNVVDFLREKYFKDPVRTNLFLNRALQEVGVVGLGTVSMLNYAPSLEYESGLPSVIRQKMQRIYARSMNYDFSDYGTVVLILRNLYKGKVGDKYGV